MKMRFARSIFVLALILPACAREASVKPEKISHEKQNMQRAMDKYDSLVRTHVNFPDNAKPAARAKGYRDLANALLGVVLLGCPTDFRQAWDQNCQAIRKMEAALFDLPDSEGEGLIKGFINGVNGEPDGGISRMVANVRTARDSLARTEAELKRICYE